MAQKVVVSLVSDLSGTAEGEDTAVGTVGFGLDGAGYELELTESEQDRLREVFAPYIAAARRLGRGSSPAAATAPSGRRAAAGGAGAKVARTDREQARAMREWARRHGLAVSDRGRVPDHIREAFHRNDPALAASQGEAPGDENAGPVSSPESKPKSEPEPGPEPVPDPEAPQAAVAEGSNAENEPVGRDGLSKTRREAIRTWAKVQGMEVKDRGILRKEVIQNANAWENTHGSLEVTPAETPPSDGAGHGSMLSPDRPNYPRAKTGR